MSETQVILNRFLSYAKAFYGFDSELSASYYHIPSVLMTSDEVEFMNTTEDVKSVFVKRYQQLKSLGLKSGKVHSLSVKKVSKNQAIVSGFATRFKEDNTELSSFGFSYTMREQHGDWKIIIGVLHDFDKFTLTEVATL